MFGHTWTPEHMQEQSISNQPLPLTYKSTGQTESVSCRSKQYGVNYSHKEFPDLEIRGSE